MVHKRCVYNERNASPLIPELTCQACVVGQGPHSHGNNLGHLTRITKSINIQATRSRDHSSCGTRASVVYSTTRRDGFNLLLAELDS